MSLIVGQVVGLSREEIAFLINADLLVAGIATLVQSLGTGPMGIHIPVMMGASLTTVGNMVAMTGMPGVDITRISGTTIAADFFGMLIAPFMSHVVRSFPPLVTDTMITSIGICLFPVAINWAGGGKGMESLGSLHFLFLSSLVPYTILLINHFICGFWVSTSVLVDMDLGYATVGGVGMVDLGDLAEHPWFGIVTPLHFDAPTFGLASVLSTYLMIVIISVESTGMLLALGKIAGRGITPTELCCDLSYDTGASFFASFLSIFTCSSLAQNIGLVRMIGVHSRYVTAVAAGSLILFSILPKAVFLVASVLPTVLGGASIAIFGMAVTNGIQILHEANTTNHRDQLLVIVNIGMGMVPVMRPDLLARLPIWMEPVTHSGIAMTVVWAVVLNLLFSILGRNDRSHLYGSHAPAPKHS